MSSSTSRHVGDVSERIHHLQKKPKDWKPFARGMAQDKAIKSMVRLCNILYSSGVRIVLCSVRSEEDRPKTIAWLKKERVKYHELRLRKVAIGASMSSSNARCSPESTKQKSCSSSKIAIESWKCGAKKAWYACSAPRASSDGEYDLNDPQLLLWDIDKHASRSQILANGWG